MPVDTLGGKMTRKSLLRTLARLAVGASLLAGAHAGRADDAAFEIGDDAPIKVPVEYHPDLGVFVTAYVEGAGPYRFELAIAGRTEITRRVAQAAGIRPAAIEAILTTNNQTEVRDRIDHASLSLQGERISLKGAAILPDEDVSADVPIEGYGGVLGLDQLRGWIVTTDFPHRQLILSRRRDAPAAGVVVAVAKRVIMGNHGLQVVTLGFDGGKSAGDFVMSLDDSHIHFMEGSATGKTLLSADRIRATGVSWRPKGLLHFATAPTGQVTLGDLRINGTSLARNLDPLPYVSPLGNSVTHVPPVDGAVGLRVLGRFEIVVDNQQDLIQLRTPAPVAPRCEGRQPGGRTLGFSPWVFEGRQKISSVVTNSAADQAGVRPGDDIVSIDGATVQAYYEKRYENHLHCLDDPQPVTLVLQRGASRWEGTISPQ